MTLSFRDIMAADVTALEDAATAWKRMSKRFGELRGDYNSHVRGPLSLGHWAGLAKVEYDGVARVSAGEFDNAKSQAQGIATLLTEAYEDLAGRKKALGTRVREAEDAKMTVDGNGRVTLDTTALTDAEQSARRHDPSYASALDGKVREWQSAIDRAVESVNEADAAIKAALEAAVAPPDTRIAGMNGFNPDRVDYAPPGSKEDLDRILREYRVDPDPDGMVEYPRNWLLRQIASGGVTVTAKEADMLDELGISGLQDLQGIREDAFGAADDRFPSEDRNDDHNDSFRHAYWNALMTKKYGADWTEEYTLAHEAIPGNRPEREAMDLHNNEVGRRIAQAHPDASEEELADLVEQACGTVRWWWCLRAEVAWPTATRSVPTRRASRRSRPRSRSRTWDRARRTAAAPEAARTAVQGAEVETWADRGTRRGPAAVRGVHGRGGPGERGV